MAPKRAAPVASSSKAKPAKKVKKEEGEEEGKAGGIGIGIEEGDTPLVQLYTALEDAAKVKAVAVKKDGVVVYWMRNKDIRLDDNRALALASETAVRLSLPLVILHILSPSDYRSHSRSPRRIDFQIRAITALHAKLQTMNVPIHLPTFEKRKEIPDKVAQLMESWGASHLYGNIEYEVDELGRDEKIVRAAMVARETGIGWGGQVVFMKDFCLVGPGEVLSKTGTNYSVFSPFYKNWSAKILANPSTYIGDAGTLVANTQHDATNHPLISTLLLERVPNGVEGFMLEVEDQETMNRIWPVGDGIPQQVLHRFLKTKIRPQVFQEPPLHPGAVEVGKKDSKIGVYATGRNHIDQDGTSHLSAYLAAGMISPRAALRATMELTGGKLQTEKETGIGTWVSEVAWRDFYQHVLAAWPRVCRGKPFNLKFDTIVWENSEEHLQAWKDGKTGFPIVDAGMRALKQQGYMHNRLRMITAMFLTKDLLLDWRLGEKHFMENLIDGDLGSNNGGWQWSASTGTDSQPYFRVFNPLAQSEKSDISGDYIKHFVPELAGLKGKALHDPSKHLSRAALATLGYPQPIVDHAKARIRAIARYKNPGQDVDE